MQRIFFKKKKIILLSLLHKPENSHMQKLPFGVPRRRKGAPPPPRVPPELGGSAGTFSPDVLPKAQEVDYGAPAALLPHGGKSKVSSSSLSFSFFQPQKKYVDKLIVLDAF